MNATPAPTSRLINRAQKVLIAFLAIIWIAAGGAKLAALSTFQEVLGNHGVLSPRVIHWAWVVPCFEIVIGILVLVAGGNPRLPRLRRITAVLSSGLLVVFCFYIARVPEEIFQSVGCGCEGALGLTDFTGSPSRAVAIGIDLALAAAGWAIWRESKRSTGKR